MAGFVMTECDTATNSDIAAERIHAEKNGMFSYRSAPPPASKAVPPPASTLMTPPTTKDQCPPPPICSQPYPHLYLAMG